MDDESDAVPEPADPVAAAPANSRLESVSVPARLLHFKAVLDSFSAGEGGFVSDFYLASIRVDRALVRELHTNWLWRRADGGYEPQESEAIRIAVAVSDALDRAGTSGDADEDGGRPAAVDGDTAGGASAAPESRERPDV